MEIAYAIIHIAREKNLRCNCILVHKWLYLVHGYCIVKINKSILGKGVWRIGGWGPIYEPLQKYRLIGLPTEVGPPTSVKYGVISIIEEVLDTYGNMHYYDLDRIIAHCDSPYNVCSTKLDELRKKDLDIIPEQYFFIDEDLIKKQFRELIKE